MRVGKKCVKLQHNEKYETLDDIFFGFQTKMSFVKMSQIETLNRIKCPITFHLKKIMSIRIKYPLTFCTNKQSD